MSAEAFEVKKNGEIFSGAKKIGELLEKDKKGDLFDHQWINSNSEDYLIFRPTSTDPAYDKPHPADFRIARIDKKENKIVWRGSIGWDQKLLGPVFYKNVIIAGFVNIIYGIDAQSGKELWVYSVYSGNEDSFAIRELKIVDNVLTVGGDNWGKKVELEFNPETGERVYQKTKLPKIEIEPIYNEKIRAEMIQQDSRSRRDPLIDSLPMNKLKPKADEPTRPPVPNNWDSFRMGITILTYSKDKKVGIIIDPLKSNAKAVIEEAKKLKNVKWLYVFDSLQLDKTSPKFIRKKILGDLAEKYPKPKQLIFEESFFALDVHQSGQRIDLKSIVDALGATPIEKSLDRVLMTDAGPIIPHTKDEAHLNYNENQQGSFLALEWGPYRIGLTHSNLASKYHTY